MSNLSERLWNRITKRSTQIENHSSIMEGGRIESHELEILNDCTTSGDLDEDLDDKAFFDGLWKQHALQQDLNDSVN